MVKIKSENKDVMWHRFSDKYPEPYRNIKIDIDNKDVFETKTYKHNGRLMIRLDVREESSFKGIAPKLLDQSILWCYNNKNIENK